MPTSPEMESRRRLYRLVALLVSALAVTAVVVAVLRSPDTARLAPGKPVPGARETKALFAAIPQDGIALGNPRAPVTLVEFGDLQCPACAEFAKSALPEIVSHYVRTGRVRLVFRNLDLIGHDSLRAARMAGAVGRQRHLWEFIDLMYKNQGAENSSYATDRYLAALAGAIPGVDVGRALRERASASIKAQIDEARQLAGRWQVRSTPTVLLVSAGNPTRTLSVGDLSSGSFTGPLDRALAAVNGGTGR